MGLFKKKKRYVAIHWRVNFPGYNYVCYGREVPDWFISLVHSHIGDKQYRGRSYDLSDDKQYEDFIAGQERPNIHPKDLELILKEVGRWKEYLKKERDNLGIF